MKNIRKLFFKLVDALPRSIRGTIVRSQLYYKYENEVYGSIVYKIAETKDELEQAFKIVQEAYEETNLLKDSYNGLRVTKYNLLPTTTVLIAKHGDEVVGTISQIMDTQLGLPVDSIADISHIRETGQRISEVSSFAVKKKWRTKGKSLLLPLTTALIKYMYETIGSKYFVCVVNKKAKHFYEDLFGAYSLELYKEEYDYVNCEPPIALYSDMSNLILDTFNHYLRVKSPLKSLHKMIHEPLWGKSLFLPQNTFDMPTMSIYNKEVIRKFFSKNDKLLNSLNNKERAFLYNLYFTKENREILKVSNISKNLTRINSRFYTSMNAFILHADRTIPTRCFEVSRHGVSILNVCNNSVGDKLKISVDLNKEKLCVFNVCVAAIYNNRLILIISSKSPYMWSEYIHEIESRFYDLDSQDEVSGKIYSI